jgi:hypothetical protein
MLAGLEVWDSIAATRLGKPRARRARSAGPAQMMALMRLPLKSPRSQSPSWLSCPRTSRASLGLIRCGSWFPFGAVVGAAGGGRHEEQHPRHPPTGRPEGPLSTGSGPEDHALPRQVEQRRSTRSLSSTVTARTGCLRLRSATTEGYRRRQNQCPQMNSVSFPLLRSARCRRTVSCNPIAARGSPTLTARITCKPLPAVIFPLCVTLPRTHPVLATVQPLRQTA